MEEEIFEKYYKDCEYCEVSYYESDTGYTEYECGLMGCECLGSGDICDGCPLSFKYQIER